jgi:hypothetical protein
MNADIQDVKYKELTDRIIKIFYNDPVKSLLERHPGESRGPGHLEITGFRLSPE